MAFSGIPSVREKADGVSTIVSPPASWIAAKPRERPITTPWRTRCLNKTDSAVRRMRLFCSGRHCLCRPSIPVLGPVATSARERASLRLIDDLF
jgi:hypothetical protein